MNWFARLSCSSIVPRVAGLTVVVLMLAVSTTAARVYDLDFPGSDLLAPAIARADNGDGDPDDGEGDPDADSGSDGDPDGDGNSDGTPMAPTTRMAMATTTPMAPTGMAMATTTGTPMAPTTRMAMATTTAMGRSHLTARTLPRSRMRPKPLLRRPRLG